MGDTSSTEQKAAEIAANQAKAEQVANRPVKTTLDIVKEAMAARKKDSAAPSEAGVVEKAEKPREDGRTPDGKFEKSAETKSKEQVAKEERALNALRRAKVSATILDKLSDEDRIQMGHDLAEQQAKVDRMFSEKGKESRGKEPEKGQPKADSDDLKKSGAALAESLAVDEDALEGLDARTRAIVEPIVKQSTAQVDAIADQMASIALDTVLSRLGSEFPEIGDAKIRAEVVETAHRLADSDDSDEADVMASVERIARDAIWRVCRDSIRARRSEAEKADTKAKAAGSPAVSARHGDGSIAVGGSTLDKLTAYKRLKDSGYSHDQAVAAIKPK